MILSNYLIFQKSKVKLENLAKLKNVEKGQLTRIVRQCLATHYCAFLNLSFTILLYGCIYIISLLLSARKYKYFSWMSNERFGLSPATQENIDEFLALTKMSSDFWHVLRGIDVSSYLVSLSFDKKLNLRHRMWWISESTIVQLVNDI